MRSTPIPAILLTLSFVFSLCFAGAATAAEPLAPPNFSGGSGTANDPYRMSNPFDLMELGVRIFLQESHNGREYRASHYRQTADIDLSDLSAWAPIGAAMFGDDGTLVFDISFSGIYDGGEHKIVGLHYTHQDAFADLRHYGLFGTVYGDGKTGGIVKNVVLEKTVLRYDNDKSRSFCGGIVGRLIDGKIENCTVSGRFVSAVTKTPNGQGTAAAGSIVGWMQNGQIVNCTGKLEGVYAQTTTSFAYAGGIVGFAERGSVENCTNHGLVRSNGGENTVGNHASGGGIVGYTWYGQISDCINRGPVSADAYGSNALGGGIVGGTSGGELRYCINEAAVEVLSTTYNSYAGGLVGSIVDRAEIANCLNRGNVSIPFFKQGLGGIAGGIAGTMNGGRIAESLNEGNVSVATWVATAGGIVGIIQGGVLADIANSGNVSVTNEKDEPGARVRVGGILGSVLSDAYTGKAIRVERVFCIGEVTAKSFSAYTRKGWGALVGFCADRDKLKAQAVYWLAGGAAETPIGEPQETGTTDKGISRLTREEFSDGKKLAGLDFKKTWHYLPNAPYPIPQNLPRH